MRTIDYVLLIHAGIFLVHTLVFLLYQLDILSIDEDFMIICFRVLNVIETIILLVTRFVDYGPWGTFGLAAFYILNIILLVLQFIFADWGIGHKFSDCLWIAFYIFMFMLDIFKVNIVDIDAFLQNSFLGEVAKDIIVGLAIPAIKALVKDAFLRNE